VGVSDESSLAYKSGLRSLDIIKSINGNEISYWRNINHYLSAAPSEFEMEVVSYLEQDKKLKARKISIKGWSPTVDNLKQLGIEATELYLARVIKGSPAENAGLQVKDKIVSLNGEAVSKWADVLRIVGSFDPKEKATLSFEVSRYGKTKTLEITPKMTELMNKDLREENRYTIGIVSAVAETGAPHVAVKMHNPLKIIKSAWTDTWVTTSRVALGFWKLVTFDVSPKNISGVLRIGEYAGEFYRAGMSYFLRLMAMISVNLFILNLLPIPVLDGGHLFFYGIEAIKGSPVSLKKMEMAQQFGFIMLLFLMGFSLFNDFVHFLK